jgi:hypothetical protein
VDDTFPNVPQLNKEQFRFSRIAWSRVGEDWEPASGKIDIGEQDYSFYFSHEYDQGNTYIVHGTSGPVYYFTIEFGENEDLNKYHIDDLRR